MPDLYYEHIRPSHWNAHASDAIIMVKAAAHDNKLAQNPEVVLPYHRPGPMPSLSPPDQPVIPRRLKKNSKQDNGKIS